MTAPKYTPAQIAAKIHSLLPRARRAKLNGHEIEIGRVRVAIADGVNVKVGRDWWQVLPAGLSCAQIASHVSWLAFG